MQTRALPERMEARGEVAFGRGQLPFPFRRQRLDSGVPRIARGPGHTREALASPREITPCELSEEQATERDRQERHTVGAPRGVDCFLARLERALEVPVPAQAHAPLGQSPRALLEVRGRGERHAQLVELFIPRAAKAEGLGPCDAQTEALPHVRNQPDGRRRRTKRGLRVSLRGSGLCRLRIERGGFRPEPCGLEMTTDLLGVGARSVEGARRALVELCAAVVGEEAISHVAHQHAREVDPLLPSRRPQPACS